MDRYLDIKVLPDPEFPVHQLMNALFAKLHRSLAELQNSKIAVSFPEVDEEAPRLGRTLRLHGFPGDFEALMNKPWLNGMRDHIEISELAPVPEEATYRRVRRVQVKSNPDRIRRRQMKRHGWSEEEARRRIPDSTAQVTALPYLSLGSASTGHRFRLFLKHETAPHWVEGTFNSYGLSQTGTVPWF